MPLDYTKLVQSFTAAELTAAYEDRRRMLRQRLASLALDYKFARGSPLGTGAGPTAGLAELERAIEQIQWALAEVEKALKGSEDALRAE